MTGKDYLQQLGYIDKRVDALLEEKEQTMATATRITASLSGMHTGRSEPYSRVENAVCKLVDLEREIDRQVDALVDLKREAKRLIAAIPDSRYRDILCWRYINLWGWEKISQAMDYDRMSVWRLHNKALTALEKVMASPEHRGQEAYIADTGPRSIGGAWQ